MIRRRAEQALRVGDRVVLKDQEGVPVSTHGREGEPPGVIPVKTLLVKETRTRVNVLWQDGTRETLDASDTVPYLNPDEYDCWYVPCTSSSTPTVSLRERTMTSLTYTGQGIMSYGKAKTRNAPRSSRS